jgi:hypothetical protein
MERFLTDTSLLHNQELVYEGFQHRDLREGILSNEFV